MIIGVSGPDTDMILEELPKALNNGAAVIRNKEILCTPNGLVWLQKVDDDDPAQIRLVPDAMISWRPTAGIRTPVGPCPDLPSMIQEWAQALDAVINAM